MFHVSRGLYRELAPALAPDRHVPSGARRRKALLRSCETVVHRVVREPYFSRPARSLFEEIRFHFAPVDQPRVWEVVEGHMARCCDHVASLPEEERFGQRQCEAAARHGEACHRLAIKSRTYCPSHRHLEEVGAALTS